MVEKYFIDILQGMSFIFLLLRAKTVVIIEVFEFVHHTRYVEFCPSKYYQPQVIDCRIESINIAV